MYVHTSGLHMHHHRYAKPEQQGEVRMHRRITTAAVEDFAVHTPQDEVDVVREEDIVYTRGVLTHAAGVTTTKILLQVSFLLTTLYILLHTYSIHHLRYIGSLTLFILSNFVYRKENQKR